MRISDQMTIRKTHTTLISFVYRAFNLSFETLIDGASNFSPTIQYSVSDIIYNFDLIFFNDMLHWSKSSLNMQHSLAICHPASTQTEIARCKPLLMHDGSYRIEQSQGHMRSIYKFSSVFRLNNHFTKLPFYYNNLNDMLVSQ